MKARVIPLFKFKSTCIDDDSSAWLASYGDVNRYDFLTTRPILTDGFVHTAEGYAKSCAASNSCSGAFTDTAGQRAMGYYDQGFLNYYYYMASQFCALRSLVLAGLQQDHRQSHRHLHRRHHPGPGQ